MKATKQENRNYSEIKTLTKTKKIAGNNLTISHMNKYTFSIYEITPTHMMSQKHRPNKYLKPYILQFRKEHGHAKSTTIEGNTRKGY